VALAAEPRLVAAHAVAAAVAAGVRMNPQVGDEWMPHERLGA